VKKNTVDLNYSYQRKTTIKNNILNFSYEYDLNKKILDADIADMILYTCQRDINLQKIMEKHDLEDIDEVLEVVNEYRLFLINNKK